MNRKQATGAILALLAIAVVVSGCTSVQVRPAETSTNEVTSDLEQGLAENEQLEEELSMEELDQQDQDLAMMEEDFENY